MILFKIIKVLINFTWPLIKNLINIDEKKQNWYNEPSTEKSAQKISSTKAIKEIEKEDKWRLGAPIHGRKIRITSGFGLRHLNIGGKKVRNFHTGVDFGGGGSVVACEDVIVKKVLRADTKYPSRFEPVFKGGKLVTWKNVAPKGRAWTPYVICIGQNTKTKYKYKHVKPSVKAGDKLNFRSKLGDAGNYGYSMGAHLHFEVWPYEYDTWKAPVDPVKWLKDKGVKL